MIIDCISDLHGYQPVLKGGGDLLIVAGDLTASDTPQQHHDFLIWLDKQDYKKKIFIGGNHDNYLYESYFYKEDEFVGIKYLCDNGIEYEGFNIWGSPWTNWFEGVNPNCTYHMIKDFIKDKWDLIPDNTDILITHSPPFGILDLTDREWAGCEFLDNRVQEVRPKLHVFGHIHESYGKAEFEGTIYVNASIMNGNYHPKNKPIRIIL